MISVEDIINICNGYLLSGSKHIKYSGFTNDTRNIKAGNIYVGIRGENFDGNIFYKEAFSKGASLCILDNKEIIDVINDNYNIILVNNSIEAVTRLATFKRSLYDIPVIAITGSVGKTSVKDMIYNVLSTEYKVLATKGNLNNHIGVPFTILGLEDHDILVIEMGMNHFNELHNLSMMVKPTMSLITNIGTAHIGNLGSRKNILKAKLEILDGMNNGILFINNDNDLLRTVKYNNLVSIGIDYDSDYMAKNIESDAFSSCFDINGTPISLRIGSNAFIYNALFAYAVGKKIGIKEKNIISGLKNFKLTPHRLEVIKCDKYTIIDDTYNASLDSVKNSISLLSVVKNRKVFIFADILEANGFDKEIHKEVGNICIKNKIDLVICIGNMSKYTYKEIHKHGIDSYYFINNNECFDKIGNLIRENDTILVKGSHSMNLVEIVNYLKK